MSEVDWDELFLEWGIGRHRLDQQRWKALFDSIPDSYKWFNDRSVLLVSCDTALLRRMEQVCTSDELNCRKVIVTDSLPYPDTDFGRFEAVILWDGWHCGMYTRCTLLNCLQFASCLLSVDGECMIADVEDQFVSTLPTIGFVSSYLESDCIVSQFPGGDDGYQEGDRGFWVVLKKRSSPHKPSRIPIRQWTDEEVGIRKRDTGSKRRA